MSVARLKKLLLDRLLDSNPPLRKFNGAGDASFTLHRVELWRYTNPAALAEKVVSRAVRIVMMMSITRLRVFLLLSFIVHLLPIRARRPPPRPPASSRRW